MPKLTRDIIKKAAEKVRIDPYSQSFQPKDLGLNANDYGSFSDYCSEEETESGRWSRDTILKVAEKTKSGKPLKYLLVNKILKQNEKIKFMRDPLEKFNWATLYDRYDALCGGFNGDNEHLKHFGLQPESDRELYYLLVKEFLSHRESSKSIPLDLYKAMLYWKLYSQPAAVANILGRIDSREDVENQLMILSEKLPLKIERDVNEIIKIIQIDEFSIFGMGSFNSFPVRTTFLHFIYPEIVPIFDKMVLQAVDINEQDANHDIHVLEIYIPFAWKLADKYKSRFEKEWSETPIRLIDMALWVNRGDQS